MRPAWRRIHLALGLALGGFFALLGLTGSVLVFYVEIDRWLHPLPAQATQPRPPLEAYAATLAASFPERTGSWRIEFPDDDTAPIAARYYQPAERAHREFAPLLVTLDPVTAEVVRQRFWGDDALTWIYDLHYSLLADRGGRWAVGALGVFLLMSLASGVYLAWPRRRRWRTLFRLRPRRGAARATYDVHVAGGTYGGLALVVLAFTGAVLALPEWVKPGLASASPLFEPPTLTAQAQGRTRLPLDELVAAARREFPRARLAWVETPASHTGVFRINLHQQGEPGRRFPRTNVWLDPYSGAVLATRDGLQESRGDGFLNWMHPLHNGEALGLAGRLVVFVAGLLPTLLLTTGVLRWRQKGAAQAHRAPRGRTGSPS